MSPAKVTVLLVALPLIAGCPRPAPVDNPTTPLAEAGPQPTNPQVQPARMKITAYINVTSGCQAETVALVNKLAMDHADRVDLELVDFGSAEGAERWRRDGLECMTLLFNNSPVLGFPGPDGSARIVVFTMPAGFSWTHDDLQDAFSAIALGTAEVLTEEQARAALAPKLVTLRTAVRKEDAYAIVDINNKPVLKIRAGAHEMAPLDRAKAAQEAIDAWAANPIHTSELSIANLEESTFVSAKDTPIIQVTSADAKAANAESAKQLAVQWLAALKRSVDEAAAGAAPQSEPRSKEKGG